MRATRPGPAPQVYVHDVKHVVLDNLQFMTSGQGTGFERFDNLDRASPDPGADVGRGEPSPGTDVAGVRPVLAQMWQGCAQSWRRCGRGEPSPDADAAAEGPIDRKRGGRRRD